MPPPVDLTGRTFGRWEVLHPAGRAASGKRLWHCQCRCGQTADVVGANLTSGVSTQCRRCADTHADRGHRTARPRPSRPCDHCGTEYTPLRSTSLYCSPRCKAEYRWSLISSDPGRRQAHARDVTDRYKRDTYTAIVCDRCGQSFVGPPTRLHCSRACLELTIASGKYRTRYKRKLLAAELVAISIELEARNRDSDTRET